MDIVNQIVIHRVWGEGIVLSHLGNYVEVAFMWHLQVNCCNISAT